MVILLRRNRIRLLALLMAATAAGILWTAHRDAAAASAAAPARAADGWTIVTNDHSPCSHYEHTLAVVPEGPPEILTHPNAKWEG